MQDVQTLLKIKDNLRGYSLEEKAIGLAIAWTESTWNFNANQLSGKFGFGKKQGIIWLMHLLAVEESVMQWQNPASDCGNSKE